MYRIDVIQQRRRKHAGDIQDRPENNDEENDKLMVSGNRPSRMRGTKDCRLLHCAIF